MDGLTPEVLAKFLWNELNNPANTNTLFTSENRCMLDPSIFECVANGVEADGKELQRDSRELRQILNNVIHKIHQMEGVVE